MRRLKFAFFGAGWFAEKQLAAWHEVPGAQCVALYNRTLAKGKKLARTFNVPKVYDNPDQLYKSEKIDFVDIVTNPFTLSRFVHLAAKYKVPVISQKPMAPSVPIAQKMVNACRAARIPFFIHENWRWQRPLRQLKSILDKKTIGNVFRARITMVSGFPVFINEPTLSELKNFILTDMGTHILDIARFFFGEARSVCCQIQQVHKDIKGEDVATVMLKMGPRQSTVVCEIGYPENHLEHDVFPQTLMFLEGEKGSIELGRDYWLRVTTKAGTRAKRYAPPHYPWSDPVHQVVDASIVDCHKHLLKALRKEAVPETTGEDNLRTLKLTYACYDSARKGKVVYLK